MKTKKLKIGLALSVGAAKGFAHIGVLQELEKNNIKPDLIAGASAGSIIGALYASGMSPKEMKKNLIKSNWEDMFDFIIPKKGLIKGEKFESYLNNLIQKKDFKDLKIPLYVIATNITKKQKAIFHKGSIIKAIRASSAIPGIFTPIKIHGDDYVDGGLVDPIPIEILKQKGADIIIAVDLSSNIKEQNINQTKPTKNLLRILGKKMVFAEVNFLKQFLKATEFAKDLIPGFLRKILHKIKISIINRFIRPGFIFKFFATAQVPQIISVMHSSINLLEDEFTKSKLLNSNVDIIISPAFKKTDWAELHKANYFIKKGANAAKKKIKEIKTIIKSKSHH